MTQTNETVELRMDLWPASTTVTLGDESTTYDPARLLVGADEVWIYYMVDGVAELVYNQRIESISGRRTIGWTAEMGDGSTLYFQRASGCGCGNPLRGFHPPFQTVQIASL